MKKAYQSLAASFQFSFLFFKLRAENAPRMSPLIRKEGSEEGGEALL